MLFGLVVVVGVCVDVAVVVFAVVAAQHTSRYLCCGSSFWSLVCCGDDYM